MFLFFFFQAEDGIRDRDVTGVQTCALPISGRAIRRRPVNAAKGATITATRATPGGHRPEPRDRGAAVAAVAAGDRAPAATGRGSRPACTTADALIRNTSTATARDHRCRARTLPTRRTPRRPMRLRALREARKEPFPSAAAAAAGAIEPPEGRPRGGSKTPAGT